ncbi:MAG: hypothetical protein ACKV2O_16195 [Acidimicrobiales bacterium]
MAQLVAALGTSHTPLLVTDVALWPLLAERDRTNPMLYDANGSHRTYDELASAAGDRYLDAIAPAHLAQLHRACQDALDRLAVDLQRARPDVVIIVGDDQHELFDETNQPAIAIGWADRLATGRSHAPPSPLNDQIWSGYAMDRATDFPGHPQLAKALIGALLQRGFDVASVCGPPVPEPGSDAATTAVGYGHAYGFVLKRLLGERSIPVVPVLLNTFYPPNQPSAARCHDLGRALAEVLADLEDGTPEPLRVALVASGGWSHFVVDEALDEIVLHSLQSGDGSGLRDLPAHLLEAGSSEIRNWITVAGAVQPRPADWVTYLPVRRSPAGTGVGCGFASWVLE